MVLGTRVGFGQAGRRCSVLIDSNSDSDWRNYVGGMVGQGVSKDCIFNEEFGHVFKSAVGVVVYELR